MQTIECFKSIILFNKDLTRNEVKKLFMYAVVMLVAINAAIIFGIYIAGKPFEFNYIVNVVAPLICAVSSWQIVEVKAN